MDGFSKFKNLRPVSIEDLVPKRDYSNINKQIEESKRESFNKVYYKGIQSVV